MIKIRSRENENRFHAVLRNNYWVRFSELEGSKYIKSHAGYGIYELEVSLEVPYASFYRSRDCCIQWVDIFDIGEVIECDSWDDAYDWAYYFNPESVIVGCHPSAIAWLHQEDSSLIDAEIIDNATKEDVAGKIVYGNIPIDLASKAVKINYIQFHGDAPRNKEYSIEDMYKNGAYLESYHVKKESQ